MPGPWSVKGIDEETREVARAAAQAAGIPIGQWIDRAILRAASQPLRPAAVPPAAPRNGNGHDVTVADAAALPPEPADIPDPEPPPAPPIDFVVEEPAAPPAAAPRPEPPPEEAASAAPEEPSAAPLPEVAPEPEPEPEPEEQPPAAPARAADAAPAPVPEPAPPPPPVEFDSPPEPPGREAAPVVTLTTGSAAATARERHQAIVMDPPVPRRRRRSSHILAKIGLGLATGLVIGTLVAWLTGGAPWSSDRAAADRAVARIQVLLTELHFDPGPADGVMRPQTAEAIARFQQIAGIPVDGKPGSAVLAELEAVVAPARGNGR